MKYIFWILEGTIGNYRCRMCTPVITFVAGEPHGVSIDFSAFGVEHQQYIEIIHCWKTYMADIYQFRRKSHFDNSAQS